MSDPGGMGTLVYTAITSFDGYVNDTDGRFDWAAPSDEVHAFVNDLERGVGTYLLGRRLYETLASWETSTSEIAASPVMSDYQRIWRAARKRVYSTTLDAVTTSETTLERVFDPAVVASFVKACDHDVSIGGAHLGARALRAGIVGEIRRFLTPVVVGGGTPFLPDWLRLDLDLLDERRFASGVVYVRYRVRPR